MLSLEDVTLLFQREFSSLLDRFNVYELLLDEAQINGTPEVNSPGVYLFWHPDYGVIKVGKSQSNAKKRSLEHLRDNTSNDKLEMASLQGDPKAKLLLFNIASQSDLHWVLSLEAFLEWNSDPLINSARMG